MSSLLGDLSGWVKDVIEALSYGGLFLLVALENIFPPIPSEIILPFAGFLTGQGDMNFVLALLAATLGSLIGAAALYSIGHVFGERRVRAIIQKWGKWLGFKEEDIDKADEWFDKYGGLAVLICRLVPIIRSLISIPAGLRGMPIATFTLYTTAGSLLWNSVLIGAGWLLGNNWDEVEKYVGYLQNVVIAAVLVIGVWWVWARMLKPWLSSRETGGTLT